MLVLPIKKKWFDMIACGEKKEEYREIKPYYIKRFDKYFHDNKGLLVEKEIIFRNGYSYNSPSVRCICWLCRGNGREDWGGSAYEEYFVLQILKILEVKNYDNRYSH